MLCACVRAHQDHVRRGPPRGITSRRDPATIPNPNDRKATIISALTRCLVRGAGGRLAHAGHARARRRRCPPRGARRRPRTAGLTDRDFHSARRSRRASTHAASSIELAGGGCQAVALSGRRPPSAPSFRRPTFRSTTTSGPLEMSIRVLYLFLPVVSW